MIKQLQTAGRIYTTFCWSNTDNKKPRNSFKSKVIRIKCAKYKGAQLKLSSSYWKILVSYLQNTINKQKHSLSTCIQHSNYCSEMYKINIKESSQLTQSLILLITQVFLTKLKYSAQVLHHDM